MCGTEGAEGKKDGEEYLNTERTEDEEDTEGLMLLEAVGIYLGQV